MPRLFPALAFLAAVALASCDAVGPVNEPPPEPPTEPVALATLLADADQFTSLAELLETTPALANPPGDATVFAPDDEAFALVSPETVAGLARQPGVVERLLARHVVTRRVDIDALSDGDQLPTVEGTPLPVRIDDQGTVFVGGVEVEGRVGVTPAGPVYRLARVVRDHLTVRERLAASPLLSRSLQLFDAAGIDLSQPGTYFVPLDVSYAQAAGGLAAFTSPTNREIVAKTLRALVVPGELLTEAELRDRGGVETLEGTTLPIREDGGVTRLDPDGTPVFVANLRARNAIVHIVGPPPQGHLTVTERIRFLPQASTFQALLGMGPTAAALEGPGPFTVFVPVEAAFDSVGTGGTGALFGNETLRSLIAGFHVVPRDVPAASLVTGTDLPTLSDQTLRIRPDPASGDPSAVARASLTDVVDLPAVNGRLHLTGSLLNPDLTAYDQLILSGFNRFRIVATIAGYRDLLSSGDPVTVFAPVSLADQLVRPGFECRAAEVAGDHILARALVYAPRLAPFFTDPGDYIIPSPESLLLNRYRETADGPDITPIGSADIVYTNFVLANGSRFHAVHRRMRWYTTGVSQSHAVNIPPC